jgi:hypothetical protein
MMTNYATCSEIGQEENTSQPSAFWIMDRVAQRRITIRTLFKPQYTVEHYAEV